MADVTEIWKPIKDYEGLYEISNLGRIKSISRNGTTKCDRIISSNRNSRYDRIGLRNKERKYYSVHRLVAETFIPNPDSLPQVDHINGNSHDNRVENLRWVTALQNMNNPVTRKKHLEATSKFKNNVEYSKPIEKLDVNGNVISKYPSIREAARQNGLCNSNIANAANNKKIFFGGYWHTCRTCGGFYWRFV